MKTHIRKVGSVLISLLSIAILSACEKGFQADMASVIEAGSSEPLQFDRSIIPEATKASFKATGACVINQPVSIQVDQLTPESFICAGGSFSHQVQLSGADGAKVIAITTTGPDGRQYRDTVTVIKDTTSPTISILTVVPKVDYVIITGSCEDGLQFSHGQDVQTISTANCVNSMFQISASLTKTAGSKTLEISQIDKAGNRGVSTYVWNPDTTPPILSLTAPVANSYVGATMDLAGLCESGVVVTVSGSAVAQAQNLPCNADTFSAKLNVGSGSGVLTLLVSQTDVSGNKSEISRSVIKDIVAPSLTIIAPANGMTVSSNQVTLSGACETGLPVNVQGAGVSAPMQLNCANSAYSSSVVLSAGTGTKLIEVSQTDLAGNKATVSRSINSVAPVSGLTIAQPAANSFSKGSITLSGACDNGGVLAFSGDIVATAGGTCSGGAYSKALTFSTAEGLKTVTVKQTVNAVDSVSSRSFTKDSVAPTLTIVQPAANEVVKASFVASGTCESGLTVVLSGGGLSAAVNATCSNGVYSATLTTSNGDGTKSFSVSQTDAATNSSSVSRSVTRDTTQPMLTIASPANNAFVQNTATIAGSCEAGLVVALSGAGLSASVNASCPAGMFSQLVTLSSGEGAKSISAKQTDAVGNSSTVNLSVTKDTVGPTLSITEPAAGTKAEASLTIKGACETGLNVKASGAGVASEVTTACTAQAYVANVTFSSGDGIKAITMSQTDAAGNTTSVVRQFEKGSMTAPVATFAQAKAVMDAHCVSCHKAGGSASYANFALTNENDFVTNGYVVAGQPNQSKLVYRMLHYKGTYMGAANMPLGGNATTFPVAAYDQIVSWITNMQTAPPPTNTSSFACTDPSLQAPSLSYTLTKNQYVNTMKDLFGDAAIAAISTEISVLPMDGFDATTNSRSTTIATANVEAYFLAAKAISNFVGADNTQITNVFGSCALQTSPAATCIDTYLNGFAKRIHRRPLTSAEITYGRALANRGGDYKTNIKTLLALHLQSPSFIWRLELGKTSQSTTTSTDLTPYETASRISYMAADTMPDATLLTAADNNQLATIAQVQAQVRRVLQSTAGREKMKKNLLRWSLNDKAMNYDALPADLRQGLNTTGLGDAAVDEAGRYVDYMVYSQNASFKTLLTSKVSLASNASLAQIYGHTAVSGSNTAQFAGRRQGLLMRSPAMSSARTRTGIIRRGVDFQKQFYCNEIPPPTANIVDLRTADELTPAEKLMYSNRDAIAHQTSSALCMSCHNTINPTGFAFENMDPFGRIRVQESIYDMSNQYIRSLPIVTGADVPIPGGRTVTVQDAFDLVTDVSTSSEGAACFSRYAFRYANERRESAEDNCQLDTVHKTVMDQNKSVLDSIVELIGTDKLFVKKN